jgi:CrcB protein
MTTGSSFSAFAAVGAGAACGAWLRWGLGVWLNPITATLPLGTLAANLVGGFGLTTFSTFSAEAFHFAQRAAWGVFALHLAVHVAGSLLMTWAGYAVFNALRA